MKLLTRALFLVESQKKKNLPSLFFHVKIITSSEQQLSKFCINFSAQKNGFFTGILITVLKLLLLKNRRFFNRKKNLSFFINLVFLQPVLLPRSMKKKPAVWFNGKNVAVTKSQTILKKNSSHFDMICVRCWENLGVNQKKNVQICKWTF